MPNAALREFQDFKPVHAAAYMGDLECVKMLAKYGANLAAPSAEGFTALSAAFLNKELTLETIEPLVMYLLDNASFGKIAVNPGSNLTAV